MNIQLPLKLNLESHSRLDDYVGDAAGRLQKLDQLTIVFGEKGSGKSHLLQGLCRQTIESGGYAFFVPLSISLKSEILKNLEEAELVCLDDIDEILDVPEWQLALFHFINSCRDQGVRLVMSSTRILGGLAIELLDLMSRLKGAYMVRTDPLSDEDKLAIIRVKAHRRGFKMDKDVCTFILSRSRRDMHHLSYLVDQLDEATLRQQKKVTIPFVKRALGL